MQDRECNEPQSYLGPAKSRRKLRWFCLIAGALVLALVLVRITQRHQAQARLETIRKAGFPASLDELNSWYAIVPWEENAALKFLEAADSKVDATAKLQQKLPVVGKIGKL